jgi:uncharacterized protein (DUF433 family)
MKIEAGFGNPDGTSHQNVAQCRCGPLRHVLTRGEHKKGIMSMTIKWQDYIEENKEVMLGKPVFKGTRLTVEHVLRQIGTGMSNAELLEQYPTLRAEHILAAALYAADVVTMDQSIYQ